MLCTLVYSQQTVCGDNKNIEIKLLKLHTAVTIKHPVKYTQVTKYGKKDNAKMSKKFIYIIYSATHELNFGLLADISVRLTDRIQNLLFYQEEFHKLIVGYKWKNSAIKFVSHDYLNA